MKLRLAGLLAVLLTCTAATAAPINIVANVLDGVGEGFNDAVLGADRLNALNFALGVWESAIEASYVGETVTIDVAFDNLGGSATSATLGFAGSNGGGFVGPGASDPVFGANVFRNAPLLNHAAGSDVFGGSEMTGTFNSDVDGGTVLGATTFYYGTDGNAPAGTVDFVSVALHEVGHGLGFSGTLRPLIAGGTAADQTQLNAGLGVGANYLNGGFINSFDANVVRKSDGAVLSTLSEADRYTAVIGDDIAWNGASGIAANGGQRPDLEGTYSSAFGSIPAGTWILGSTYSHVDEDDFSLELMSPLATAGTGNSLSALTLGMMEDLGWTINSSMTAVPEPSSAALLLTGLVCVARRRRKRRQQ